MRLPEAAVYTERNGRASAEVGRTGNMINVTANCDSLMREVELYEELYYRARDALEEHENALRTSEEEHKNENRRNIATGLVLLALLTIAHAATMIIITSNKK